MRYSDVIDNLCAPIAEEKLRWLRGLVADELEIGVSKAAGADAEWELEAQVAARLRTPSERGCRGNGHIARCLRRWGTNAPNQEHNKY